MLPFSLFSTFLVYPLIYIYFFAILNPPIFFKFLIFFFFFRAACAAYEVPRLGIKSELQLLAYSTATTTQDLSHMCSLYHSSWPCQILNPLREARDRTHILMEDDQVHYHRTTMGTPLLPFLYMLPFFIPSFFSLFLFLFYFFLH